jgi:mannose-6-phosphate isomerase-like protein (cupin superfamily)
MGTVLAALFLWSIGSNISSWAQARRPAPAKGPNTWVKVPKSEMTFLPGQTRWRTARILNMDNKYYFGVSSNSYLQLRPEARTGPSDSMYHTEVTEVFYIVKGKGVAALGGELEDAYWDEAKDHEIRVIRGPSVNGRWKNYDLVPWEAGDTIIVPTGVPHALGYQVFEQTEVARFIIDPSKSLDLVSQAEMKPVDAR